MSDPFLTAAQHIFDTQRITARDIDSLATVIPNLTRRSRLHSGGNPQGNTEQDCQCDLCMSRRGRQNRA